MDKIKSDFSCITICTILYKPTEMTLQRLREVAEIGYTIYIVDNTPDSCTVSEQIDHPNIRLFSFGKNIGIGRALQLMGATAYYNGSEQLLYFDQDSIFTRITLEYISDFAFVWLKKNNYLMNNFACVTFRDFLPAVKNKNERLTIDAYDVVPVDFTISSGSLFDLEKLKIVGWHNESFYIDGVDYAVCISIAKSGYKVGEIGPTPEFDHSSEQEDDNYRILGYRFRARCYPFYRYRDYIFSSIRLILHSASFSPRRTFWLLRNLFVFIGHQLLVRISQKN
jgi:GT2 family glycosyltransferase